MQILFGSVALLAHCSFSQNFSPINPAKEAIRLKSTLQVENIQIFDSKGIIVYHSSPQQAEADFEISTANFRNGIYFMIVRRRDITTSHKIVVSK